MSTQLNLEIKGQWYLPGNVERQVPGVLAHTTEKGSYLTIEAPFGDDDFDFIGDSRRIEVIQGVAASGQAITLFSCFVTHIKSLPSFSATIYANRLFIGCHADDWGDFRMTEIKLQVAPLFMWLESSGLRVQHIPGHEAEVNYTFKKPDDIVFNINDKVSGRINFTYRLEYPNSYSESIGFSQSVVMSIETKGELDLHYDELRTYSNQFIDWLTIATGYPCEIEKESCYHRTHLKRILREGTEIEIEVSCYSKKRAVTRKPKWPQDFIIKYPKIREDMSATLTRWFVLCEQIEVVIQILRENMGRDAPFSEFHFKDIVQALEAFHRKLIRNQRMPKDVFKEYKNRILAYIPEVEDRKFTEERLNYANEPSLRDRLNDLIDGNNVPSIVKIIGDKTRFICDVIDNRNYLTHLDSSGRKNILDPVGLHLLSEKALALLFTAVLSRVITDSVYIDEAIRSSRRWSSMIR